MFQRKFSLQRFASQASIDTTITIDDGDIPQGLAVASNSLTSNNDGGRSSRRENKSERKFRARLRRYLSSIGSESLKASPCGVLQLDDQGRCNYQTLDGKFDILIAQEAKRLSISTEVYSCASELQSIAVMKKALELNHLARGDRHGFSLGIDPSAPIGSTTTPMTLGITRSMSRMSRGDVLLTLNNFIEVASNVRSKLEEVDDGRLGAAMSPFFNLRAPTHQHLAFSGDAPPDPPTARPKKAVTRKHDHRKNTRAQAFGRSGSTFNKEKSFAKTGLDLVPPVTGWGAGTTTQERMATQKAKEEFQKKWRQARRMSVHNSTPSPSSPYTQPRRVTSLEPRLSLKPWGVAMDQTPVISNKKQISCSMSKTAASSVNSVPKTVLKAAKTAPHIGIEKKHARHPQPSDSEQLIWI